MIESSSWVRKIGKNSGIVDDLYTLLGRTQLFIETVSQIDNILESLGWVPIMMGLIDFGELVDPLAEHVEACEVLLQSIHENDAMRVLRGGVGKKLNTAKLEMTH